MPFQSDRYRIRDWTAETPESINARLEGIKNSQGQTRLTLVVMAIISTMMIVASYNAYFSYDYDWIVDQMQDNKNPWVIDDKKPDGALDLQALRDWASARTASVSLLGIRVSVDDSPVLGTGVLLVLSLWLVLVTRRENYTIGFLLRDTDTPRPNGGGTNGHDVRSNGQRWLIFHSIISNSLFMTIDDTFASVGSLEPPPLEEQNRFTDALSKNGFAAIRSFFFLFPAVTALLVFLVDRWSYRIPDPFTSGAGIPPKGFFYYRSMVVFVFCWLPLIACCMRAKRYSNATQSVLRAYGVKLQEDLATSHSAA